MDVGAIAAGSVALLPHWGCIDAEGPETDAFLQSQLSSDVAAIPPDGAGIGGYCTPKGRLLTTFVLARGPDGFRLLTGRDVLPDAARRLSMYVLRAKLKIHDRGADFGVLGAYGDAAPAAIAALGFEPPAANQVAWREDACVLGLPPVMLGDRRVGRWLLAAPAAQAADAADRLGRQLATVSADVDRWLEVLAGVPRITAATREAYVPQMINYELVDGVGFRKGCYPGQEVVARTQYLGKLKRRMFAARLATPPADDSLWAPGAPVHAGDAEVGSVVLSAPAPDGGAVLLVEYRMQAAADAELRVAGEPLLIGELPYSVPDATAPAG
mgnify:CR=1 FL=1